MALPYYSKTMSIREILGLSPMHVPAYQRNYCWDREQVEQLWTDLLEAWEWQQESGEFKAPAPGYFLGSIVTIPAPLGEPYTLLDGQQRLATITIILASIRDRLKHLGEEDKAEETDRQLIKARNPSDGHQLKLSKLDAKFFANILETTTEDTEPRLRSHKLLQRAKQITQRRLEEILEGKRRDAQLKILLDLRNRICENIWLVNVTVENEEEAETVFEILNARGVELGVSDLLRNFLINEASDSERDSIAQAWDELVEDFKGKDLSKLIRHSWMSRYGDVSKKQAFLTIKNEWDRRSMTSGPFLNDLRQDADTYLMLTDTTQIDSKDREMNNLIFGFNALGGQQALPLLLAVARRCPAELKRTLKRVNALMMQYSVLDKNPNQLEAVYSRLARDIQNAQNADNPAVCSQIVGDKLRDYGDEDMSDFAKHFAEFEPTRTALQRYILWELEKATGSKIGLDLDPSNVHVDHIYPQKPRMPSNSMTSYLNRLGNLTLLSAQDNREMSNASFEQKCRVYKASGFQITRQLATYTVWNESAIIGRQKTFAESAKKIWEFE